MDNKDAQKSCYPVPPGGLPPQSQLTADRSIFTNAYAVIPAGVQRDIVTSYLPHWERARCWILARPLSGFAESFSYYIMEIEPGGGSAKPEADIGAEAVLFVVSGNISIALNGKKNELSPGGYCYLPAGAHYQLYNHSKERAVFHWIRKRYQLADDISSPDAFFTHLKDGDTGSFPGTNNKWQTTRFVDPLDLRHDMHVNIVTFEPGGSIPFAETHVMEHAIYILEGKAVYRLNQDWVEVEAGDFLWLRAFCPQACYAGGPGRFRYLLYKDVNRHSALAWLSK